MYQRLDHDPSDEGNGDVHNRVIATPGEAERLGLKKSDIYLMLEGKLPAIPEQLKLCRLILTRIGSLRDGFVLLDLPDLENSETGDATYL